MITALFVFKRRTIKTHWIKSASSNWQLWKFFSLWRSLCSKCFCSLSAGEGATAAAKSLQSCPTMRPHRWQPTRLLKSRLWETSPPSGSGAEQVGTSLPSPWQSHCWRPKLGWEVLPIIMLTPALNIEFSLFGKYMFAFQYPMELSKAWTESPLYWGVGFGGRWHVCADKAQPGRYLWAIFPLSCCYRALLYAYFLSETWCGKTAQKWTQNL